MTESLINEASLHISLNSDEEKLSSQDKEEQEPSEPENKKLNKLLKTNYIIEPENHENSDFDHQNSEKNQIDDIQNETAPKKLIKKPRKPKKEQPEVFTKPENTKRFLSAFPDSEEEKPENQGEIEEEHEQDQEEPVKKPKKQRRLKKNKENFAVVLDADAISTQEQPETHENDENELSEKKRNTKFKLVRLKKKAKKLKENQVDQENNEHFHHQNDNDKMIEENSQIIQQNEDSDEPEHKLSRLKKRSKIAKTRESLIIEEKPPGNLESDSSPKKPKKKTQRLKKTVEQMETGEPLENTEKKEVNPKKQKKNEKPTKSKGETTQEILERLKQNTMFFAEEESDEEKPNMSLEDNNLFFGVKKEQKKRIANQKNHLIIKTRNKFFKEINTMECNPLLDDQQNPEEDEFIPENNEILLDVANKKPKQKIDVNSFLDKFHKFKEERALNITYQPQPTNKLKDSSKEPIRDPNSIKEAVAPENSVHQVIENNEVDKENECAIPRQGDLLFQDPPNTQNDKSNFIINDNNTKNASNLVENHDNPKKIPTTLKATSQELSQFLNNTFSNFTLDETSNLSLQISIPNLNKMNSGNITDTTLFVNKLARSNSLLNKSLLSMGTFSHTTMNLTSSINMNNFSNNTNVNNRDLYKSKLMEEIRKRKSKNINFEDLQGRFKQTDWAELTSEKQKNQEKKLEEKEQDDEDDSDYNPEENKKEEIHENNNNENNIDYKKIIELEEGLQPRKEQNPEDEKEDIMDNDQQNNVNDNKLEEVQPVKNNEEVMVEIMVNDEEKKKSQEVQITYENLKAIDEIKNINDEIKKSNDENQIKLPQETHQTTIMEVEEENLLEDTRTLKKLRKIAENVIVNYEEERLKKKAEKKALHEAQMNDPRTKKIMQNMFEMEAELGSDNEENDDNVKRINKNDDEERESDEEVDEELKEMIDNITTVQEGEGELLWNKFYTDILKQDKENLKKVLDRAFNIKKRKSDGFQIVDDDRMTKVHIYYNINKFNIFIRNYP